jgi:hypothetical protein
VCIGALVQKGAKQPFFASESASPVGMHTDATVQSAFCTVFRHFLEVFMVALKNRAEVAERVIDAMVGDGLSLRKACLMHNVSAQTVLRAVDADRALAEQYDRARAAVIERLADEVMELADAPVAKLDNGATDPGLVRQRQLQVDTRKWFLSKLAPKVYGDRLDVQVSDSRISITGALAAAQLRLVDVIDATPRLASPDAMHDADDAGGGRAKPEGPAVT